MVSANWFFPLDREFYLTTKCAMSLRSPTENENEGLPLHMLLAATRHSRARQNRGLFRQISLDTRFREYDGTRDGFVLIPVQVFSKEALC